MKVRVLECADGVVTVEVLEASVAEIDFYSEAAELMDEIEFEIVEDQRGTYSEEEDDA